MRTTEQIININIAAKYLNSEGVKTERTIAEGRALQTAQVYFNNITDTFDIRIYLEQSTDGLVWNRIENSELDNLDPAWQTAGYLTSFSVAFNAFGISNNYFRLRIVGTGDNVDFTISKINWIWE